MSATSTISDTDKIKTQSWQVGKVKITRVVELEMAGGSKFILPDARGIISRRRFSKT